MGGSDNDGKYFFFEIHYDNPNLKKNIRDYSGIRYHVTTKYRKNEIGILSLGTGESFNGIIVPPNTDKFNLAFTCSTDCTDVKYFEFF